MRRRLGDELKVVNLLGEFFNSLDTYHYSYWSNLDHYSYKVNRGDRDIKWPVYWSYMNQITVLLTNLMIWSDKKSFMHVTEPWVCALFFFLRKSFKVSLIYWRRFINLLLLQDSSDDKFSHVLSFCQLTFNQLIRCTYL